MIDTSQVVKEVLWSGETLKWCFPNQRIMLLFSFVTNKI